MAAADSRRPVAVAAGAPLGDGSAVTAADAAHRVADLLRVPVRAAIPGCIGRTVVDGGFGTGRFRGSSTRRRSVGGTTRPVGRTTAERGVTGFVAPGVTVFAATGTAAAGVAGAGVAGAAATGASALEAAAGVSMTVVLSSPSRRSAAAVSVATSSVASAVSCTTAAAAFVFAAVATAASVRSTGVVGTDGVLGRAGALATAVSTTTGSTTAASTRVASAAASSVWAASAASASASSWAALVAFAALFRRGGPSRGFAGTAGSALAALPPFARLADRLAGLSENIWPVGSSRSRSRASRSANCRATISSIVLDALLTSIPCSLRSTSMTSWLGMPSTSATL